jgi:hypothetical protein
MNIFALEEEAFHQFVTVLTGTRPKKQVYFSLNCNGVRSPKSIWARVGIKKPTQKNPKNPLGWV